MSSSRPASPGAEPLAVEETSFMKRLIVVSNRIPVGRPTGVGGELEVPAGGLVSALLGALEALPESLWIGWDSHATASQGLTRKVIRGDGVPLLGLHLDPADVRDYYDGFCNQALWPLLHFFTERLRFDPAHLERYEAVQERFADSVAAEVRSGDAVWVHDYHLLLLASCLRERGVKVPLGFFLHTTFPPHNLWMILPRAGRFLTALLEFDVMGFQTENDLRNYRQACEIELGARWDDGCLCHGERRQRLGVYPVGIDPADFRPGRRPPRPTRREGELWRSIEGRSIIIGVDRLDYTKGLLQRFRAFELLLRRHPEWKERVCLVQIASPSRSNLPWYRRERRELEELVGRINGELGRLDWSPIRYLHRSFPRSALARIYRAADIGLVTPLRDGMNLVAKEYVSAQDPADPGVLVLSRFAGAAERLREAVLVNPYVPTECAEGIYEALEMQLAERQERHAALLADVESDTAARWATGFLDDLNHPEP
jgi:trehalose 6-phosphate synthase